MSPLGAPPEDLGGFPRYDLTPEQALFRIHRRGRSPWWFSSDGSGRFDVTRASRGTCYLAEREVGAFIEVFRHRTLIPEAEVAARRLATLHVAVHAVLADCTVEHARAYGVTGAIHTQPDYELPRRWASAFEQAGFAGVRYRVSHDPSLTETAIALFGPAGEQDFDVRHSGPIGEEVILEARRRFRVVVAPTPEP